MSPQRAGNGAVFAFPEPPRPSGLAASQGGPRLDLAWERRGQNFVENALALLRGPVPPKEFCGDCYFRDCWVSAAAPRRALCASILWHVAFVLLVLPLSRFLPAPPRHVLPQTEITWYGPVTDLPAIAPASPVTKPRQRGPTEHPRSPRGADGFHPRETIVNNPMRPNHPRQTLIEPDASPEPPRILPSLPNIVALSGPSAPRLEIDPSELARLRPRERARLSQMQDIVRPELPNQEQAIGALSIAESTAAPKPALPLSAMSASRPNIARVAGETAPDISAGDAADARLIALSALPGLTMPPAVPAGNLSSHLAISPEGNEPGTPGGAPAATGNVGERSGAGPVGLSISGGRIESSAISGAGRSITTMPGMLGRSAPDLPAAPAAALDRTQPGALAGLMKRGAPPEELLGTKRIYKLHINMPNLTSATGSWVLSFAPLEAEGDTSAAPADLSGPEPLTKVDPKYPPELRSERVEGEVILYAVIRADGSVDSIQLVAGIDPTLDTNAMEALAQWKFRPAERKGAPVELGAIVHVPFRAVAPAY
jgi:TonB family protein